MSHPQLRAKEPDVSSLSYVEASTYLGVPHLAYASNRMSDLIFVISRFSPNKDVHPTAVVMHVGCSLYTFAKQYLASFLGRIIDLIGQIGSLRRDNVDYGVVCFAKESLADSAAWLRIVSIAV